MVLDKKLAEGGMTLRSHGQQFLDLVEHIEAVSNGERRPAVDHSGDKPGLAVPVTASVKDGEAQ